jgi:hypothetical protein
MRRPSLVCVVCLLGACAPGAEPALESAAPALRAIADCAELERTLREDAIAEMEAAVDKQMPSYLNSGTCWQATTGGSYGGSYAGSYGGSGSFGAGSGLPTQGASPPSASAPPASSPAAGNSAPSAGGASPTVSAPSGASVSAPSGPSVSPSAPQPERADSSGAADGPSEVSGTNNQVVGVDEADIVKSDGHYLYLTRGGALRILEAWPAEELRQISQVPLQGVAKSLFVEGDRALVYVSEQAASSSPNGQRRSTACTYGYDCDFAGDGTRTRLALFDISDRAQPRLLREIAASGSLLAARRIGNAVHTVVSDAAIRFDGLRYTPAALSYCNPTQEDRNEGVRAAFEALKQENAAIINQTDVLGQLPHLVDGLAGEESAAAISCNDYFRSEAGIGSSFVTLFSFEMNSDAPVQTASIVSRPGAVYASEQSLYLAVRDVASYGAYSSAGARETSSVHRFAIGQDPSLTRYEASGKLRGHVLNQFALDEWNGNLRVATSLGRVPDPSVTNMVSILERSGATLRLTDSVRNIAPQEDIRSVRFDGPRGFIVTFKKTDPLFVLDLSKPYAPALLGELKIPGFSTYMHMLDEQHLLTIGYDADDQGSFAWFQGVLLQIFDVSNPREPKLAHKELIGTRGSSSEALTNHLAFNYFAPKGLLSFPITICEGGSAGSFGTNMTFSGLIVYDVDTEHGFRERGRVAHPSDALLGSYDNAGCSNWWTRASSVVKRSVIMDDYVYSIADNAVRVQDLNALGQDVAALLMQGP